MNQENILPFNIQHSHALSWNVKPILHEIRHALQALIDNGASSIIDLRSIPLAPGEEEIIIDMLGQGEVHASLECLGPSEIYETGYAGVWLITHYNESNNIISRFIEITEIPEILKSQQEDLSNALLELEEELLKQEA